ncbi:hypothetical protein ANN_03694 [Periplaneta americana]|uniref:Uncharacterized protein n=1 Tax=Periplaneta americana TaxID=6978 RepID=A0ABQ8U2U9_PERAM|nr:hypothetical protein ANN_03694 [Periplaneta americana]
MAGLCEGGNEPPGSLKANKPVQFEMLANKETNAREADVDLSRLRFLFRETTGFKNRAKILANYKNSEVLRHRQTLRWRHPEYCYVFTPTAFRSAQELSSNLKNRKKH